MANFHCNVISYTLRRTVDINVIIPTPTCPDAVGWGPKPARHTPDAKYPLLYLFHGYGNNQLQWTSYTNIELFAEERQIAVVMIAAENKCYVNHPKDRFFDFIEEELPDFMTGMFPVSGRKEDTYVAGLSMGGYGALMHGLSRSDRYQAIGAFSAAVGINPRRSDILDREDVQELLPEDDLYKVAEKAVPNGVPKIYMSCGETDTLLETDKKFYQYLKDLGADIIWSQTPGYGHMWRFWNEEIERFLDWIPRTDAYAGSKRQI